MIIEKLQKMTREELVTLAITQGLPKPHHNAKDETIIKMIMDSTVQPVTASEGVAPVKADPIFATEEEVENLVAHLKAKNPRFETIYDHEAKCVTFRYNGAEDCMSLSVLPRWMQVKASKVNHGRLSLRAHSAVDFEPGNASSKNAYTNVVLV